MPFARITLCPAPSAETTAALATDMTALIAEALRKRHDLTAVLIETPTGLWTVAGQAQTEAAVLEVRVTQGSNTAAEKRAFLRQAMGLLRRTLPGLHPASYAIVTEVPGSDWGYDGQTQADRAQRS